ncbi:MAG: hypothetical protein ACK2UP_11245 [Candidatus Promineifilaceae bacterium]
MGCLGGGGTPQVKETPQERELANLGRQQQAQYERDYPQVEQMYFDYTDKMKSPEMQKSVADNTQAGVNSSFSNARRSSERSLSASGYNPNEGAFKTAIGGVARDQAVSGGDSVNRTQQSLQDSYLLGQNNIVAAGQGQEAKAIAGYSSLADAAHQKAANDAAISFDNHQSRVSTAATALGAGSNAYYNYNKPPPQTVTSSTPQGQFTPSAIDVTYDPNRYRGMS